MEVNSGKPLRQKLTPKESSIYHRLSDVRREIRLVRLIPQAASGSADENGKKLIHCTFNHTVLGGSGPKPIYTALSYTWGDLTQTKPIIVDNIVVQVTANLELALQHLQYSIGDTPIWVDSICINQTDVEEKNKQVQMMGEIFETATHTIVWLGPAEVGSDELIDYLNDFGREAHENRIFDLELLDRKNWTQDEKGVEILTLPNDSMKELISRASQVFNQDRGLKKLTSRPWWSRVWVRQELFMSKDVIFACGTKQISYDNLSSALMLFSVCLTKMDVSAMGTGTNHKVDPAEIIGNSAANKMLGGRRDFRKKGGRPLVTWLTTSHVVEESVIRTHATDSRDRIYSQLGLSIDISELGIVVDYHKSYQEVYIDTARALLRNGALEILTMCRSEGKTLDLPSWVPDWTAPILIPWMGPIGDKLFSASGDSHYSITSSAQRDAIILKGVHVDNILECGHARVGDPPTLQRKHNVENLQEALTEVENFVQRSDMIDSEDHKNAVWRILIVDQEFSPSGLESRRRATARSERQYRDLRRVLMMPVNDQDSGHEYDGGFEFGSYLLRMGETHNSRPFLSEKGYVGQAPAEAEVGDLICILYGAPVPFVLRKKGDGQYQLMGEAYVHGIMDGEFLKGRDVVSEEFVLQGISKRRHGIYAYVANDY